MPGFKHAFVGTVSPVERASSEDVFEKAVTPLDEKTLRRSSATVTMTTSKKSLSSFIANKVESWRPKKKGSLPASASSAITTPPATPTSQHRVVATDSAQHATTSPTPSVASAPIPVAKSAEVPENIPASAQSSASSSTYPSPISVSTPTLPLRSAGSSSPASSVDSPGVNAHEALRSRLGESAVFTAVYSPDPSASRSGLPRTKAHLFDESDSRCASPILSRVQSIEGLPGSPRLPAARCQKRRIELRKEAESRFGVDLCRINGSVYVLNVHEKDDQVESSGYDGPKYLPGYRAGLSRFDELVQLHDEDIDQFNLEDVYKKLHVASKIVISVRDRPSVHTYTFRNTLELDQLLTCLDTRDDMVCVAEEKIPEDAAWFIPRDEPIAEVNGQIVLGMKQSEIAAVLKYAMYKSTDGTVEVSCIVPVELAQAFLASFQMTTSVYGENSWTDRDHLRRSLRHHERHTEVTWQRRSSLRDSFRRRRNSSTNEADRAPAEQTQSPMSGRRNSAVGSPLVRHASLSTGNLGTPGPSSPLVRQTSASTSSLATANTSPSVRRGSVSTPAVPSPITGLRRGSLPTAHVQSPLVRGNPHQPSPLAQETMGTRRASSAAPPRYNRFAGRALE